MKATHFLQGLQGLGSCFAALHRDRCMPCCIQLHAQDNTLRSKQRMECYGVLLTDACHLTQRQRQQVIGKAGKGKQQFKMLEPGQGMCGTHSSSPQDLHWRDYQCTKARTGLAAGQSSP